jgi:hypothetical protein
VDLGLEIRLCPATHESASGKPKMLVDHRDWFGMGFLAGVAKRETDV